MFLIGVKFWELLGGIEMAMATLYLVAMGVRQVRVFVGVAWGGVALGCLLLSCADFRSSCFFSGLGGLVPVVGRRERYIHCFEISESMIFGDVISNSLG